MKNRFVIVFLYYRKIMIIAYSIIRRDTTYYRVDIYFENFNKIDSILEVKKPKKINKCKKNVEKSNII